MIEYKNIDLPCLSGYFAGNDGNIYKLKKEGMMLLTSRAASDTWKSKMVHLVFECKNKDLNFSMRVQVAYLVCGAFHGFFRPFNDVGFHDNDEDNTKPENLYWTFNEEKKIEKFRTSLDKINKFYNKTA